MPRTPPSQPSLATRRKAAAAVLRRRVHALSAWQGTLAMLLVVVATWATLVVLGVLDQAGDVWNVAGRLIAGQTKETFLLGWLTYAGWRITSMLVQARRRRRAARIALTLLRRGHPQWYQALA